MTVPGHLALGLGVKISINLLISMACLAVVKLCVSCFFQVTEA